MAELKPGYILHSDPAWVRFHIAHSQGKSFGYTRGVGAPMKNVAQGGYGFFMPKGIMTIAFRGNFNGDFPRTIRGAWEEFGPALGAASFEEWRRSLDVLRDAPDSAEIRVLLFDNLTLPVNPIPLAAAGVHIVRHATKGWSIEQPEVDALLNFGGWLEDQDDEIAQVRSAEGRRQLRVHKAIERDQRVVRAAKVQWLQANPGLPCMCCEISFVEKYGERGRGFIEAHHLKPLGDLGEGEEANTSIGDLAPVCSNCHRMLHRSPFISIQELKSLLSAAVHP